MHECVETSKTVKEVSVTHLIVHRPSHILQIAVVEEGIAIEFHPHSDLFYTDCPDFCYRVTVKALQDRSLSAAASKI